MIIMIILLILSAGLVIGTAIYLNLKKKKDNINVKQTSKQDSSKKSKNKAKKQLSNILEIKIKDNIICLGNRYSIVVRLGNIDYNMLSNSEQETIEDILMQTALSIDYPIQFFSTTEYIDTSKIIALIRNNNSSNSKIQEYKELLIEYLQNLQENRTISTMQNYAVISYDGLYKNMAEELNRKALSFKGNLLRANISCSILSEDELYSLIYRELNKNSVIDISKLKEGGKTLYVGKRQKTRRNKHI